MSMNKPFKFIRSPEDVATYARWRRRMLIFYGSVGLIAIVAVVVLQLAHDVVQMAGK
jgi:hypothetical protein